MKGVINKNIKDICTTYGMDFVIKQNHDLQVLGDTQRMYQKVLSLWLRVVLVFKDKLGLQNAT